MDENKLLRLWGKTDKNNPENYHPLLFHLLDVGNVAQILWCRALSPQSRQRVADALGLSEEDALICVTLLAAQHDLGKASAFQHKDARLWNRLKEVGLHISAPIDKPHGYVSASALRDPAEQGIGGWKADFSVVYALAKITGGHHGTFPTSADMPGTSEPVAGNNVWKQARLALLQALPPLLFPSRDLTENPVVCSLNELTDPALLPLIGGLISVADWIGSSSRFPPTAQGSLKEYQDKSEQQAEEAVQEFGWAHAPVFAAPAEFGEIFKDKGKPFVPNAMQRKTGEWADAATEPYLMIIEAAMGEGKTEAALYAVDRALSTKIARGFYVALPTQATGNAMFGRVEDYLAGSGHGGRLNLQLVHAGALLSKEFEKLLHAAAIYDDTADPEASAEAEARTGRVVAESWFTARKRPLLARFGVGTIDQSLLGVLQTRHWFVRLLGLAGKVVVFDEVHAYDVYMSSLLCRLLSWLRALDCTVILLSATLPASSRAALTAAWGSQSPPEHQPYPRLTLCRADAPPVVESVLDNVLDPDAPARQTALEKAALGWVDTDWESVEGRMRRDLPDGGCALLLCNTVTRAQQAFRALRPKLEADGWDVCLFHARTLANWRQVSEKRVLDTFDKKSAADRRGQKVLLIATQIVEQSLDLDFDWIASEMAPADLILQRLGRLWRHPGRKRSATEPYFVILCGKDADGFPVFPDYAELIYSRYILLRSWLALQNCGATLTLPGDIDSLVQKTYKVDEPEGLSQSWLKELATARSKMSEQRKKDEGIAETNMIPKPAKPKFLLRKFNSQLSEDDDPTTHQAIRASTRLGRPSISFICFGQTADGTPLAEMSASQPNLDETRALLGYSISSSRPELVQYLSDESLVPRVWRENAHLRFHRSLTFKQGKSLEVPGLILRLSKAEGLVIESVP